MLSFKEGGNLQQLQTDVCIKQRANVCRSHYSYKVPSGFHGCSISPSLPSPNPPHEIPDPAQVQHLSAENRYGLIHKALCLSKCHGIQGLAGSSHTLSSTAENQIWF